MLTTTLKGRVTRAAAGIAAAALVAGMATSAGADPKQFVALRGVGSDTIQDVANAFAGFNNNINYVPLQSSLASGKRQIASFDAFPGDCIVTTPGGATFLRPNGSTNGRKALSRSIDGATWPAATALCGGVKVVAGQIDFARSSAGPAAGTTELTYIPFARDGLGFAYYKSDGGAVTTLSTAQLASLFSTGPQNIGGVDFVPCGIQTGSGTFGAWNTAIGITAAQELVGTATCNPTAADRLQENDASQLKTRGDQPAFVGKEVIVGFSAANFISQSNGAAPSALAPGVDLGSNDVLGKPYTGASPPLSPNAPYYASNYGRDVYNVVPTAKLGGLPGANADLKTMFVGASSAVCLATGTITTFGFSLASSLACGATTLRGPLLAN